MASQTTTAGRLPGQYTREAMLRLRMRCLIVLGCFGVVTCVLGRVLAYHGVEFEVAEVGLLCACWIVLRFALPVVERLDQGAVGEELVGRVLDELTPDGWRVLHDLPLGHGNVDHVAVGPAGLFTFETKSHPGPVRVRRVHGAVIRQAHAQRDRVARVAGIRVEPFLVYSSAWVDHPGARRKGVRVIPARMLLAHLRHRPPTLSPEQVDAVHRRLCAELGA